MSAERFRSRISLSPFPKRKVVGFPDAFLGARIRRFLHLVCAGPPRGWWQTALVSRGLPGARGDTRRRRATLRQAVRSRLPTTRGSETGRIRRAYSRGPNPSGKVRNRPLSPFGRVIPDLPYRDRARAGPCERPDGRGPLIGNVVRETAVTMIHTSTSSKVYPILPGPRRTGTIPARRDTFLFGPTGPTIHYEPSGP
jgi:hypothetical protein